MKKSVEVHLSIEAGSQKREHPVVLMLFSSDVI